MPPLAGRSSSHAARADIDATLTLTHTAGDSRIGRGPLTSSRSLAIPHLDEDELAIEYVLADRVPVPSPCSLSQRVSLITSRLITSRIAARPLTSVLIHALYIHHSGLPPHHITHTTHQHGRHTRHTRPRTRSRQMVPSRVRLPPTQASIQA